MNSLYKKDTLLIWCATRQVDNEKNKIFVLPGLYRAIFLCG